MRRRLLVAIVAVVTVALLLFAVPLAAAVARLQERRALDALQQQVEQAAAFVQQRATDRTSAALLLALAAEATGTAFALYGPDGRLLAAAGPGPTVAPPAELSRDVERLRRRDRLVVAVPVRGSVTLVGARDEEELARAVRRSWVALATVGGVVLAASVGAARVLGQRLAAPLEDLGEAARRLGDGDFASRAPRSGLPEADQIAAALDTTAERLGAALDRSRRLAADASHQLRTPLTALQLELEALAAGAADPDAARRMLAQADRLQATIDELLTLTAPDSPRERFELVELVDERLPAWRALAAAADRELVVERRPAAPVRARRAAVGQALQVLLDNALTHGQGTVTVRVAPSARGARLSVIDEGPGLPDGADPVRDVGGRPRGLVLARQLVEAEGGRLLLERHGRGTSATLLLPPAR